MPSHTQDTKLFAQAGAVKIFCLKLATNNEPVAKGSEV